MEQSTSPDPEAFAPPHDPRWTGGEIVLSAAALLTAAAWAGWLVDGVMRDGTAPGDWERVLLGCSAAAMAAAAWCTRSARRWKTAVSGLASRLPLIQSGHWPIESLSDVKGRLEPLAPALRDLFIEIRRQRGELRKLEYEIRDRVANRTEALERTIGSLKQKASRDALTGLLNRRMLEEQLPRLVDRSLAARATSEHSRRRAADGGGLCLLMIDVDHFKLLNDTLGHAAGDELLRSIGQLIRSALSETDLAFRCGGDEFVILMEDVTRPDAQAMAARLVQLVDGLTRTLHVPRLPRLSIGVSSLNELPDPTPEALLEEGDRLLYEVKTSRRSARQAMV